MHPSKTFDAPGTETIAELKLPPVSDSASIKLSCCASRVATSLLAWLDPSPLKPSATGFTAAHSNPDVLSSGEKRHRSGEQEGDQFDGGQRRPVDIER